MSYNDNVRLTLLRTDAFLVWYKGLNHHQRRMIDARLRRIQEEGHFGTVNRFEGLTELKWKTGLRVYTAIVFPNLFLLLGGNKNGQDKDIAQAKKILREIISP